MTILLTGGVGRTTSAIAERLHKTKIPFLVLSRSSSTLEPYRSCQFDWVDKTTWELPFTLAKNISAVYIVVPVADFTETGETINAYIDFLKSKGVQRFVLLSSSSMAPGGRIIGLVHQHLLDIEADSVVLRPTWYMDNFSRVQVPTIKADSKIYSGAQDGKIPWISCDDVGAVAFHALTQPSSLGVQLSDPILLGPELLSYDEVAAILSKVIGRRIEHIKLPMNTFENNLRAFGLPEGWTKLMVELETEAAQNVEANMNDEVKRITGSNPVTFKEWAETNKKVWV